MDSKDRRRQALLVGVSTSAGHQHPLDVGTAIDRVAGFFVGRLGFEVECCTGESATRDGFLGRLDAWVDRCLAEGAEACVFYYFGHGGRVCFEDLEGLAGEEHGYVTCRSTSTEFESVLGLEISARLARLCGPARSTVVILDCCYSGQTVREGQRVEPVRRMSAPAWAKAVLAVDHGLAVDSHPHIIRLVGSSPKNESFLRRKARGQIGQLTHALLTCLDELGEHWQQSTWDALSHRVRQRVFDEVGEGQWVGLAGPRDQLLFSPRRTGLAAAVGFVADPCQGALGWLRAGLLQGVAVGERWAVTCPWIEEGESRPRALAIATVSAVELNCAQLQFEGGVDLLALGSNSVEPWPPEARSPMAGRWLQTLETLGEAQAPAGREPLPFSWRWGLAEGSELPQRGAKVGFEDRIWVELRRLKGRAIHWYVNLVFVAPSGRSWLLNARVAYGLELAGGEQERLGQRQGAAEQGMALPLAGEGAGVGRLIMLATTLPLELAHLAQPVDQAEDPHRLQGLRAEPTVRLRGGRSPAPVRLGQWACEIIEVEVAG